MRIVSVSYSYTPGFTEPGPWLDKIKFYTGILEKMTNQNEVISIEQINYKGECRKNGVQYYFINKGGKVGYFPWKMHRFIKKQNPDIIFINGFIFPLQILQLKMMLGKTVKIIILHRAERPFRGIKKIVQQLAEKCVDAFFFSSKEFGNEWMEEGIINDKRKIHEIIQASSSFQTMDKTVSRSVTSAWGSPVFLWVGRLNVNKDPLTVIKAFIQFQKKCPESALYMIYQTEELIEQVKDLIKEIPGIILVGKIDHDKLPHWYSSADFIISGSHYEGGGIAICEAMSCGCIPILTDVISFRSITGSGKCGILYKPGNVDSLYDALIKATQMDIAKENEKVLQQFKNELSFEAIGNKIERVITSF